MPAQRKGEHEVPEGAPSLEKKEGERKGEALFSYQGKKEEKREVEEEKGMVLPLF